MKKFLAIALSAFLLAGCSANTASESTSSATSAEISSETTSSVTESSSESVSSSVSTSVEESSSVTVESSSSVSSSSTTEKPAESSSSSSSSNKPVEKPVSSSTSSSSTNKPTSSSTTKIEEKPIHTHTFTEATCTNPATCISCGETKGTTINHNYNNGSCIYCGKNDPNYVAPHNCKYDGHIWNNSYTESSTENVEIVESHIVSNCGFDFTLSSRYFGITTNDVDFPKIFGVAFGSGSAPVKTTGIKTITKYYHECSECGYKEVYKTEETVSQGTTWEYAVEPRSEDFPIIWYDINNIPDVVYEGIEKVHEWEKAHGF
ncbi:MAG: hypothetical protein J6C38_08555 [Oscillospiraceae bacterium]|nr:hypothetical protein [Oscillospiraceae bacterium]